MFWKSHFDDTKDHFIFETLYSSRKFIFFLFKIVVLTTWTIICTLKLAFNVTIKFHSLYEVKKREISLILSRGLWTLTLFHCASFYFFFCVREGTAPIRRFLLQPVQGSFGQFSILLRRWGVKVQGKTDGDGATVWKF